MVHFIPFGIRNDIEIRFAAFFFRVWPCNPRGGAISVNTLYEIYRAMNVEGGAKNFEEWLRTGWLNVARVAIMIDAELKH